MATNANIGSAFGWSQNPLYQGLASNRNALMQFGAGLASGNGWSEGIANGLGGLAQGAARDDAYALMEEEKAQQQEAINQTTEWLRQNGKDALYAAVTSGAMEPGQAWQIALQEDANAKAAASQGVKPIEINGQLVDPTTGQVMGDYRDPAAPAKPLEVNGQLIDPTSLQVLGDFRTPEQVGGKAPTDAQRRANSLYTVVAPDAELLLGDGTTQNPGLFDALGDGGSQAWNGAGVAGVNPLAGLASSDFQTAKDAVTSIAQSYLYATSGAAAPAEEVRKIADLVTPNPFDSPERKAQKRARLQTYIEAIKGSTIPAPMTGNGAGWEVIGVTQ